MPWLSTGLPPLSTCQRSTLLAHAVILPHLHQHPRQRSLRPWPQCIVLGPQVLGAFRQVDVTEAPGHGPREDLAKHVGVVRDVNVEQLRKSAFCARWWRGAHKQTKWGGKLEASRGDGEGDVEDKAPQEKNSPRAFLERKPTAHARGAGSASLHDESKARLVSALLPQCLESDESDNHTHPIFLHHLSRSMPLPHPAPQTPGGVAQGMLCPATAANRCNRALFGQSKWSTCNIVMNISIYTGILWTFRRVVAQKLGVPLV